MSHRRCLSGLVSRLQASPSHHTLFHTGVAPSPPAHSTPTTCRTAVCGGSPASLPPTEGVSHRTGRNEAFLRLARFRGMSSAVSPHAEADEGPLILWPEEDYSLSTHQGGGFYAVRLGEIFEGRYIVTRKLGFGGFSSVWLARDLRYVDSVSSFG